MPTPIPSPPGVPVLGNVWDIDADQPIGSLCRLADIHGPIFKMNFFGTERVVVASNDFVAEVTDEKRFHKAVEGTPLAQVRNGVKDGLFTAHTGEHNWEVAHRTLMPAFGPLSIRSMYGDMHDVASQLALKWARFGPDNDIDVTSDFTRLTLDTIALCAMGTRFNSFYHNEMHPFVDQMVDFLSESGLRSRRPAFADSIFRARKQKYDSDIESMRKLCTELIKQRRQWPTDKKDLLNAMLNNKDPRTGECLTEESCVNNMITFLVAGHETTSGMLSFLFAELLRNSDAYRQAQREVDEVIGTSSVGVEHMSKLPYLTACLRETLRLHPTAPAFSVMPHEDELLGGEYEVKKGQPIMCLLSKVHTDHSVYGEDAEAFRPSRMLDEHFNKLPASAWKPFGSGVRGCIGRPFAWQEALLVVATLLQNFDFTPSDPNYRLAIQSTLTIKPKGFFMKAAPRSPEALERLTAGGGKGEATTTKRPRADDAGGLPDKDAKPFSIFYGSNTGTCESLASSLATTVAGKGYNPTVDILDKAADSLHNDRPAVIVTASYEGEPPDNAARFFSWLQENEAETKSVKYAVFGLGNHEWHTTYQKVPRLVDERLAKRGATRLTDRGEADVNGQDIFNTFDDWVESKLWPAVESTFGAGSSSKAASASLGLRLKVETNVRSQRLRQDLQQAMVTSTSLLSSPDCKSRKRHIEFELPSDMSYKAGDYLVVLPVNPVTMVRRAMARYKLPWDATINIDAEEQTTVPTGRPITAFDVFGQYLELGQPVSAKQLRSVAETLTGGDSKAELEALAGDRYTTDVQAANLSLLDILERYPDAEFTLGQFLSALPAMRVRQYSISSSPLASPNTASLTYSVLDAPSKARNGNRHQGVCTTYLSSVQPGDIVQIALRPSHAGFQPPADPAKPIIMACAGTGLAPFRAFVQERAAKIAAGAKLGPALLFYGAGAPGDDDMYRAELDAWEAHGAVDVRRAYSQAPGAAESGGTRYVQDRLWADRRDAVEMFRQGAWLYVCGAGAVGTALFETMEWVYAEEKGVGAAEAQQWVRGLRGERYWADVFN